MVKDWQLMPLVKLKKSLSFPELSWLTAQLLYNRGLLKPEDIENFLRPEKDANLPDPLLFKAMNSAVDIIVKHIKDGNLITIYGDYDADGVTAAALLYETLNNLKAKVKVYIPDRVTEGYGLNIDALTEIAKTGCKLIITVDSGIRNKTEIIFAQSLGLDTVITDHHVPPEEKDELPPGIIIDPLVTGEKYPNKNLAGAGVAYKLACALINRSTLQEEHKNRLTGGLEDLVAIGTVADCVKLLGENRALVKNGLKALNRTKRTGLIALIEIAQLKNANNLDAWNIGFQIAPRLNAAGRLGHANTAFELLVTENKAEADKIAEKLNQRNSDRQRITEQTTAEVESQIKTPASMIIGVYDGQNGTDIWNEGVIGLVAGRICEKYYRPVLVITSSGNEYKGSGRSIEEFNIIQAVEACGEYLTRFGGHAGACGFSLPKENLSKFKEKILLIADERLAKIDLRPKLKIEAALRLEEINDTLFKELSQFAPFGQGNERPKFASYGIKIIDIQNMGANGQHIKLRIKNDHSLVLSAIGFSQTEKWQDLRVGDMIDIAYYLELNEFNGRREVQLKIIDIKRA